MEYLEWEIVSVAESLDWRTMYGDQPPQWDKAQSSIVDHLLQ